MYINLLITLIIIFCLNNVNSFNFMVKNAPKQPLVSLASTHPHQISPTQSYLLPSSPSTRRSALSLITVGVLSLPTTVLASPTSRFTGTYTDPNHRGGTRTVVLLQPPYPVPGYNAEVQGGGGRGEPASYVLPAKVGEDDKSIVIDFSVPAKRGPKDFEGVWVEGGGIKFTRDGNVWPKVK